MDYEKQHDSLEKIPANRGLVEALYAHGKITREAREYALDLLYPTHHWGIWIARLLLAIGALLVLSGIICFFAFNRAKVPPLAELSSIQFGIIGCLVGAYYCTLQRQSGRLLLLSGSVLVGVFMAVFGQVYQTGVDSYQLFMMWALLTLGWTLIANFAVQWLFWLVISHIFLILWWQQVVLPRPTQATGYLIFGYLGILEAVALVLREYLVTKRAYQWLAAQWTRRVLTVAIVLNMLILIVSYILLNNAPLSLKLGAMFALLGHALIYYGYRFKLPDMWSLAVMMFSSCIIVEIVSAKILVKTFPLPASVVSLLMAAITLGLFSYAIMHLRQIMAKRMAANHV